MTSTLRAEVHRSRSPAAGWSVRAPVGWVNGVAVLFAVLVFWRAAQIPVFGAFEVRSIVAGTMTLALLAMAQTVIVISGGIDLSVGASTGS